MYQQSHNRYQRLTRVFIHKGIGKGRGRALSGLAPIPSFSVRIPLAGSREHGIITLTLANFLNAPIQDQSVSPRISRNGFRTAKNEGKI